MKNTLLFMAKCIFTAFMFISLAFWCLFFGTAFFTTIFIVLLFFGEITLICTLLAVLSWVPILVYMTKSGEQLSKLCFFDLDV